MEIVFNEPSFQNKANSSQEAENAMTFLMDILLEINKITKDAITLKRTIHGGLKRKIYRHIQNGTYWYVDNLHYGCAEKEGNAAHLEVFDANKNHIGICNIYDININENRKEKGRTLQMD